MKTIKEGIGKITGAAKKAGAKLKGQSGILVTLQQQHGEVSALIKQAKLGGEDTRDELFPKIRAKLLAHAHAEAEVLYDMLDSDKRFASRIRENRREHDKIEELLGRLQGTSTASKQWTKSLEALEKEVQDHVKDEENKLFPQVEEHFDQDRLERLDDQYQQLYEQEVERAMAGSPTARRASA
jgi:hemerythrin superfamily protein